MSSDNNVGSVLSGLVSLTFDNSDNDTVDRLNHVLMYGLLLLLAVITGSKQFVGVPINCWIPAEYKEKFQKNYANNYCWVNSLYNIPFEETIPVAAEDRYTNAMTFYRWVSLIFITLAFLFRVPQLLWKELKHFSGVNVENLIGMTRDSVLIDDEERDKNLGYVAEFFHRWVTTRCRSHKSGRCHKIQRIISNGVMCYGKRSGHNLNIVYLFIKFMYLLNTIGQFLIISSILRINYWSFGIDVFTKYSQNEDWVSEDVFPRVALCDMKIRQMQNVQTFTVQCVLTLNLFLEKMFLFIWFCLMFLLIINAVSFSKWTYELLSTDQTKKFLKHYTGDIVPVASSAKEKNMVLHMLAKYLKPDGVFILRMISKNAGEILTADLVQQIWLRYKRYKSESGQNNARYDDRMTGLQAIGLGKGENLKNS